MFYNCGRQLQINVVFNSEWSVRSSVRYDCHIFF